MEWVALPVYFQSAKQTTARAVQAIIRFSETFGYLMGVAHFWSKCASPQVKIFYSIDQ